MLRTLRRYLGQLVLLTALLAGATIPAQAVTPTGGVNQCLVLAICIEVTAPGSSGSPGTGGGNNGGGEAVCTWKGVAEPCWDPDLGWFDSNAGDTTYGCYLKEADPSDPAWNDQAANPGELPYVTTCLDVNGNITGVTITWLAKSPSATAPPPTPGTVAQMAITQLQFARPVIHIAPNGKSLVGLPVFLWYDHGAGVSPLPDSETVGPQNQTVQLNSVTVTAEATLTKVTWDMGYQVGGQEKTADCNGPGIPYVQGMEAQNPPPAGACYITVDSLSPASGGPPTGAPAPSASPSPGGGYWPVATEEWTVNCYLGPDDKSPLIPGWSGLVLDVSSQPVQLQVNQIQVLN